MGPTDGVFAEAAQMEALLRAHPTLTYIARPGSHVATWMEDDGPQVEVRETLAELAAYLTARLGR